MGSRPPAITDATVTLPASWNAPAHTYYGYCTLVDVQFELSTFDSFSDLFPAPGTTNAVTGMNGNSLLALQISYAATLDIDAMLGRYYQMPYAGTDTTVLDTLRIINAKLAAARVLDQYLQTNTENATALAQALRAEGEAYLLDIRDGNIAWGPPFNDAVPMGDKPVYPLSALAQVSPNPGNQDDSAVPIFVIGSAIRFRRDTLM